MAWACWSSTRRRPLPCGAVYSPRAHRCLMSCAICCWRSRHDALAVVKAFLTKLERWLLAVIAAAVLLQLFFVLRIALMAWWAPQSTAFERTQLWQHWHTGVRSPWQQQWVDYENIAPALKKAVLTAEDDLFILLVRRQPRATQFAYTTIFRSLP